MKIQKISIFVKIIYFFNQKKKKVWIQLKNFSLFYFLLLPYPSILMWCLDVIWKLNEFCLFWRTSFESSFVFIALNRVFLFSQLAWNWVLCIFSDYLLILDPLLCLADIVGQCYVTKQTTVNSKRYINNLIYSASSGYKSVIRNLVPTFFCDLLIEEYGIDFVEIFWFLVCSFLLYSYSWWVFYTWLISQLLAQI